MATSALTASSPAPGASRAMPIEWLVLTDKRHERSGIPYVKFFDDVGEFIASNKTTIDVVIESLQTMYSKCV